MRTSKRLCVGLALAGSIVSMSAQSPAGHAAFPKASEGDLDNGLHLIILEDRRKPEISFQLVIPGAGGYYDPDDQRGLAGLTAALMRERTLTRPSSEIATQLETMTALLAIDADASSPDAVISGSCPSDQATKLLDLATDLLLNPAFADEDIELYKQKVHTTLGERRDDPAFLARELFTQAVYSDHPASRPLSHTHALDRITRDRIVEFHRTRYAPDHAVLAIAGDVSPFAAKFFVGQKLGGWKKVEADPPGLADPAPTEGPRMLFIERPDSAQATLMVGAQGVTQTAKITTRCG